jgi:hypothetical protein
MGFRVATAPFEIDPEDLLTGGGEPSPTATGDPGLVQDGSGDDLVLVFRTRRDSRVRPEHAALEGRVYELNDPDAPIPPLAPNCRCQVVITPRERAERQATEDAAESFEKFRSIKANLAQRYPADVVESYSAGDLKPDDLVNRYGDTVPTEQARAVAEARRLGRDPRPVLADLLRLQRRGVSGSVFRSVQAAAETRVRDLGEAPRVAAEEALRVHPRRGLVTKATASATADELTRIRAVRTIPVAEQRAQRRLEGLPLLRRADGAPRLGSPPPAVVADELVAETEREIARRTTERTVLLRADGSRVGTREGTAARCPVAWPRDPADVLGGVLLHDHPCDPDDCGPGSARREWWNPLSGDDLSCLANGLGEVRAVAPDGTVYSVRPGPEWPGHGIKVALSAARAATESAAKRLAAKRNVPNHALVWQEQALRFLDRRGIITYRRGRYVR